MQKVKWVLVIFTAILISYSFIPAPKEKTEIKWLTMAQLHEAYSKQPKPIIFDIYTDWCGWCKVMDRDTYSKETVINYINTKYYAVKYNAESKDSIILGNKKFAYNPAYRANNLAVFLTGGQMSYPTTAFLPELNGQPAPLAGFMTPTQLEAPLKYFGDGAYQKQNYAEYLKTFSSSWK